MSEKLVIKYRCRACGTPFFEGYLAPGTKIATKCHRKGCVAKGKMVIIQTKVAEETPINTIKENPNEQVR